MMMRMMTLMMMMMLVVMSVMIGTVSGFCPDGCQCDDNSLSVSCIRTNLEVRYFSTLFVNLLMYLVLDYSMY